MSRNKLPKLLQKRAGRYTLVVVLLMAMAAIFMIEVRMSPGNTRHTINSHTHSGQH